MTNKKKTIACCCCCCLGLVTTERDHLNPIKQKLLILFSHPTSTFGVSDIFFLSFFPVSGKPERTKSKKIDGNKHLYILFIQSSSEFSGPGYSFKSGVSETRPDFDCDDAWRAVWSASTLAPTSVAFLRIEAAETSRSSSSSSWKSKSGKLRRAEGPRR